MEIMADVEEVRFVVPGFEFCVDPDSDSDSVGSVSSVLSSSDCDTVVSVGSSALSRDIKAKVTPMPIARQRMAVIMTGKIFFMLLLLSFGDSMVRSAPQSGQNAVFSGTSRLQFLHFIFVFSNFLYAGENSLSGFYFLSGRKLGLL